MPARGQIVVQQPGTGPVVCVHVLAIGSRLNPCLTTSVHPACIGLLPSHPTVRAPIAPRRCAGRLPGPVRMPSRTVIECQLVGRKRLVQCSICGSGEIFSRAQNRYSSRSAPMPIFRPADMTGRCSRSRGGIPAALPPGPVDGDARACLAVQPPDGGLDSASRQAAR